MREPDVGIEPPDLGKAERAVVDPEIGTTLVRLNLDETAYAADGKYYEAWVTTPNLVGETIRSLFALQVFWLPVPEIPGLPESERASIGLQVSNDGGATWLVWQDLTSSWVPATGILDGFFNEVETVDRRIPLLQWTAPHQVMFKIKMTPGAGGLQKPLVFGLALYNTHDMDVSEDCARSVKRYLDRVINVPMYYMAELGSPSTAITIDEGIGLDVTVSEPITVYNLTTDPARNINLFSSLGGPDNRTINLISAQSGQLEVRFRGVPDVFIGAEEFFQISKMPSIVVFTPRMTQYNATRHWEPEKEVSIARGEARQTKPRQLYRIEMTIRVQSSLNREARQMTDAIARVLDKGDFFYSVANGEKYCVFDQSSSVREDRVAQGIWVGTVNIVVFGKMWLGEPQDSNLVREIVLSIGGQHTCNLLLQEHLRRVYRERSVVE